MSRSVHPYEPYIPEGATKLIVGTIPPYRFCTIPQTLESGDINFYYGSHDNGFWELVSIAADMEGKLEYENTERAIKQRMELLDKLNIGVTDIVQSCVHEDQKSSDNALKDREYKALDRLLSQYPGINTLLYTSGDGGVKSFIYEQYKAEHKCVDKERREYKVCINGKEYDVILLYSPSPNALRGVTPDKRLEQYKRIFGDR